MNPGCDKYNQEMLLAETGELTPQKKALLERHLNECSACRAAYHELPLIRSATRRALAVEGPSAEVMQRIRRAASQRQTTQPFMVFPSVWRVPLAAAALFALLTAGYMFILGTDYSESRARHYAMQEMRTLVAIVQDDSGNDFSGAFQENNAHDLHGFAMELLRFQGLDTAELFEDDYFFDS